MPLPEGFERLEYRGNFQLTVAASYAGSILGASLGGPYRVDETIFPRVLVARLNYSALTPSTLTLLDASEVARLDYIWDFFCARKDASNEPFLMRDPRKDIWYLWAFEDKEIEMELVHFSLATTGLKVSQVWVQGVVPDSPDGSFDEEE